MPSRSPRIPSYRLHKPSGKSVVTIDGRDIYLGTHGSSESHARYHDEIARWQLQRLHPKSSLTSRPDFAISELFLAYWEFAKQHYRKGGVLTNEASDVRLSMRELLEFFSDSPVDSFGPLALKTVRQAMLDRDLSRGVINQRISRIKRMFKWGVASELVSPNTLYALQAVTGLQRGRSSARETLPVRPASEKIVETVLLALSTPVAAMVQLQIFTGMRPGEVVIMRPIDIDRSNTPVWIYRPPSHKTEHLGRERRIFIGPKAQDMLRPFLDRGPTVFCFSPVEAVREHRMHRAANRITPMSCGNRSGTNRKAKPKKQPRECYDRNSYRQAIIYACKKCFPPPAGCSGDDLVVWHRKHRFYPHQLRHNAATYLTKTFGIEAAQIVLGHSTLSVTQVYAERDFAKAAEIMRQVG